MRLDLNLGSEVSYSREYELDVCFLAGAALLSAQPNTKSIAGLLGKLLTQLRNWVVKACHQNQQTWRQMGTGGVSNRELPLARPLGANFLFSIITRFYERKKRIADETQSKMSLHSSYWGKRKKSPSLGLVCACLCSVVSCKWWLLSSLIDKHHPHNIARHSHFLFSGLLSCSYWSLHFSTHVLRINLHLQSHLLCSEKFDNVMHKQLYFLHLFLQLSWLWLFTTPFTANCPISQIPQDFLNCSISFHLSLFLRGWSVLKKFFSFKNNFAVVLQSAWFPQKKQKIPAGLFLLLLPWLHWRKWHWCQWNYSCFTPV